MKKNLLISIKLSLVLILICSVAYPLLVAAAGLLAPGKGNGVTVEANGRVVGYEQIGQRFSKDYYFWGRPSAAGYNAAASAGSNKGPSNPAYLQEAEARIDSFLAHNPGIQRSEIPSDLVTASASGLDPDISPESALIQVKRVAAARKMNADTLYHWVEGQVKKGWMGLAPDRINVLELNCALDKLTTTRAGQQALQQSRLAPDRRPS